RPYSASEIAHRYNIPLYQPPKINSLDFVDTLKNKIRPDLLVSVAASQILKKAVLEVPPLGCINLHSAPLPRYQGMMPNFWTMVNNEPEATVTIHYMAEKLDAGDIILQKSVAINATDSLQDLMIRSKVIGVQALLEAIKQIEAGTVEARPQDSTQASYFSFPTSVDAYRLRSQGRRLL
ncbi:MAG: methionyl-tRNA formyltransferase, partial [Dolichospermum sp.]